MGTNDGLQLYYYSSVWWFLMIFDSHWRVLMIQAHWGFIIDEFKVYYTWLSEYENSVPFDHSS